MRLIRSRADARWLPSRHHFAIFRLAAYLRLRRAKPEREDVLLAIEPHQSTAEVVITGCWYFATASCYLTTLAPRWPLFVSLPVMFAVAVMLFQPLFISMGIVLSPALRKLTRSTAEDNADLNGALCLLVLGAASLHFARASSWLRLIALQYFLVIVINAAAAVLLLFLRRHITALEASYERGDVSAG